MNNEAKDKPTVSAMEPQSNANPIDDAGNDAMQNSVASPPAPEPIRWTASELVDRHRGKIWYAVATLIVVAIVALSIWTRQWTMGGLAVIILVAVLVVVRKPIREITYELTDQGLSIDGKMHPFNEFRAFGLKREEAMWQLVLIPIKRFGLLISIFIHEDQGERIVDILGTHLPMEKMKTDVVDNLTRRLKL